MAIEDVTKALSPSTTLSEDIFWHAAKSFLHDPVDVFNLARTSHNLWQLLESEIYRTDVLSEQQKAEKVEKTMRPFWQYWKGLAEEWSGPLTPDSGVFPDQVGGYDESYDYVNEYNEMVGRPKQEAFPRWKSLSILQWACCVGNVAMVEKACLASDRSWGPYTTWPHEQSLHSSVHFAAWYGRTNVLRLFEDHVIDGEGALLNMISNFKGIPRQYLDSALRHINPAIETHAPGGYMLMTMERPFTLNPLGIAILRGHAETAEYLAQFHDESRIDDLSFNEDGYLMRAKFKPATHPLHLACFMGMEGVVKILLEKGADVNAICAPVQWSTALMWAASRRDNDEIIGRLLEEGADVKVRDSQDRSPLEWALQFGATANACRMVEEGARVDVWLWSGDTCCALELSMESDRHLDCTQLIFQKYPELPDIFVKKCVHNMFRRAHYTTDGVETLRWCIEKNIGLDPIYAEEVDGDPYPFSYQKHSFGMSAVHLAAARERLPIDILASVLEKRPQDINRPSESGGTPLALAFKDSYYNSTHHTSEQVALLLAKGADPQACPTEKQRVILSAVKEGKPELEIKKMIEDFRDPKDIEYEKDWALRMAKREAFINEAAEWGIASDQANLILGRDVNLSVVNDLRSFGWSVDDIVKRACKWRLQDGERTLDEELGHLVQEEKNGLRQRDDSWKALLPVAPVTAE